MKLLLKSILLLRVTADSSGNVYVTGWTDGNLDGNINAGGGDIFVAKIGVPDRIITYHARRYRS